MSHYSKDLDCKCQCAMMGDALWFVSNPDRLRYLRMAWECEEADIEEGISQIVVAFIPRTINSLAEEFNRIQGTMEVKVVRRSFLFIGKPDWQRVNTSDEAVEQFLEFINDGDGHMVSVTRN